MPSFFDDTVPVQSAPATASAQPPGFFSDEEPAELKAVPQPQQQALPNVNPLVSAAAGVNNIVGRIPQNALTKIGNVEDAAFNALGIGGNNSSAITDNIKNYFNNQQKTQQQLMAANPNSAALGQNIGTLGVIANEVAATTVDPLFGAGVGMELGALSTDPNGSTAQGIFNTAMGALGGGGDGVYDAAATLGRGLKYGFQNVGTLAQRAIDNAISAAGGDVKDVMPKDAYQQLDKMETQAKATSDNMYNSRNQLAAKQNISVARENKVNPLTGQQVSQSNLATLRDDLQQQVNTGTTSDVKSALDEANSIIGNGKPLSFAQAHQLLSKIRTSAFEAGNSGEMSLSRQLGQVRDAFESDIDNTVRNVPNGVNIQTLHDQAQNFYHTTYAPLRDIGAQTMLADKLGQSNFASGLKKVMQNADQVTAIGNQGGDEALNMLGMAHLNALKQATTPGLATGDLTAKVNVPAYTKAVGDALKEYPDIYNKIFPPLNALKDALTATQFLAKGAAEQSVHSIGQKILMGGLHVSLAAEGLQHGGVLGAIGTVAAAHLLPKAPFFYSAGKMLANPATRALLTKAGNLPENTSPVIKNYFNKKIAAQYAKQASLIPPKYAPFFGSSPATPSQDDSTSQ